MKIHLVTYATPRFRHRQIILGASGFLNSVVDTVTSWTPKKLLGAGFKERCKGISLSERGSGYWAWKPFIIAEKLRKVPDGDLVFYCDVGRGYPFKQITGSVAPYLEWMETQRQPMVPGVYIPWKGPMSMWTKRDAYVFTGMDLPAIHSAVPLQASFSFWIAGEATLALVDEWLELASQRQLISDDPSICGIPELTDFHDHRHDQTLLTLCCLKHDIAGLNIGAMMPTVDTQHPCEIASMISQAESGQKTFLGHMLDCLVWPLETFEARLRQNVSFGQHLPVPNNPINRL
jgi:hypothetical protein